MAGFKTEIDQSKSAAAILAACIVRTLGESDPSFQARFERHLQACYRPVQERGESHTMEALTWAKELLQTDDPGALLGS
jgi:hypothetical protein